MKTKHLIPSQLFVHKAFEIGILLKGLDGLLEIMGGALALAIKPHTVNTIIMALFRREFFEDPSDMIGRYLVNAAHHFSAQTQVFVSLYLLSHGAVKIFLVISLWKRKLWAYPVAIIFFMLFILYQAYRYRYTYSSWLIPLTIIDFFIVLLTWLEYRHVRSKNIWK